MRQSSDYRIATKSLMTVAGKECVRRRISLVEERSKGKQGAKMTTNAETGDPPEWLSIRIARY